MKKHICIVRSETGLDEVACFSELSATNLKKEDKDIIAVVSTERVKHPSPEVLKRALKIMRCDIRSFYATCNQIEIEGNEVPKTSEEITLNGVNE